MMNKVAQFEKVPFEQFAKDCFNTMTDLSPANLGMIQKFYDSIRLPERKTSGSAGYDFHMPFNAELKAGESIVVPTGIRCKIEDGYFLGMFPRSGLGFKHGLHLANTVGIIDSDYYFSDNYGHIMAKLCLPLRHFSDDKTVILKQREAFCQGILLPFGITFNDNATGIRNGGFGSTSK